MGSGGGALAADVHDGGAAVEYVAQCAPDILPLESSMRDMSGFEVLRRIKRIHLVTRFAALTNWTMQPLALQTMQAGINGYLGKDI